MKSSPQEINLWETPYGMRLSIFSFGDTGSGTIRSICSSMEDMANPKSKTYVLIHIWYGNPYDCGQYVLSDRKKFLVGQIKVWGRPLLFVPSHETTDLSLINACDKAIEEYLSAHKDL